MPNTGRNLMSSRCLQETTSLYVFVSCYLLPLIFHSTPRAGKILDDVLVHYVDNYIGVFRDSSSRLTDHFPIILECAFLKITASQPFLLILTLSFLLSPTLGQLLTQQHSSTFRRFLPHETLLSVTGQLADIQISRHTF